MRIMIFANADLDHIFIRAQARDGNFTNLPLSRVTDNEFENWAKMRFQHLIPEEFETYFGKLFFIFL